MQVIMNRHFVNLTRYRLILDVDFAVLFCYFLIILQFNFLTFIRMSSRDTCSIDAVQSDSVIIFQHAYEELISPASQIQTNCSDLPPVLSHPCTRRLSHIFRDSWRAPAHDTLSHVVTHRHPATSKRCDASRALKSPIKLPRTDVNAGMASSPARPLYNFN